MFDKSFSATPEVTNFSHNPRDSRIEGGKKNIFLSIVLFLHFSKHVILIERFSTIRVSLSVRTSEPVRSFSLILGCWN